MRVVDLIIKKKHGESLTKEEIHFLISGYVKGIIPDYQMSSLLMAICFQGLNELEEAALTYEMLESGEKVDLSNLDGIPVDKHSTGGVGDKTTLVVAPILAACGLKMAKMSGRGLGHTGGTIDKLEAIPGFMTSIEPSAFINQLKEISIAVVGQTANIAPADKLIYALRDVTGTVDQVSLIASSIMSKKLASGADHILLDVKVGDGAFMRTVEEAKVLAKTMVRIGKNNGKNTACLLTNMDEPLGFAVGNAIEVIEAIETLKGNGPRDLVELSKTICVELLLMSKLAKTESDASIMVDNVLKSGLAVNKLKEMVRYQGGNEAAIDDYSLLPESREIIEVKSKTTGYVKKIDTLEIGNIAMNLGAGRVNKNDVIDLAVGIKLSKKVGDFVLEGEKLADLYVNKVNDLDKVKNDVLASYHIQKEIVERNAIILGKIKQ